MKGEVRPRKESQPSWACHLLPSSQSDSCSGGRAQGWAGHRALRPPYPTLGVPRTVVCFAAPAWPWALSPHAFCTLLPSRSSALSQRGPSSSHGLHSHKQAGQVFKLQIWSMASCRGLSVMLCLKWIHAGTCRSASCPSSPRTHTTLLQVILLGPRQGHWNLPLMNWGGVGLQAAPHPPPAPTKYS